jgi:hypothetical protein
MVELNRRQPFQAISFREKWRVADELEVSRRALWRALSLEKTKIIGETM